MENPVNKRHLDKIDEYVYNAIKRDDLDVVQIFERLNSYANLKSISQYAKDNKLSYNGVKKYRKTITLFGCKFVADND